jgi:hypothetical protein
VPPIRRRSFAQITQALRAFCPIARLRALARMRPVMSFELARRSPSWPAVTPQRRRAANHMTSLSPRADPVSQRDPRVCKTPRDDARPIGGFLAGAKGATAVGAERPGDRHGRAGDGGQQLGAAAGPGLATVAGLWAWLWVPFVGKRSPRGTGHGMAVERGAARAQQGVAMSGGQVMGPLATTAAAATFVLHTAREAIYLSPGHGRRPPPRPPSSAPTAPVRTGRRQ